jgi:hypothetical protein
MVAEISTAGSTPFWAMRSTTEPTPGVGRGDGSRREVVPVRRGCRVVHVAREQAWLAEHHL